MEDPPDATIIYYYLSITTRFRRAGSDRLLKYNAQVVGLEAAAKYTLRHDVD